MNGFPDPCGQQLARAVHFGADPSAVVPDNYVVVRGGIKSIPPLGTEFSAVVGPTTEAAAAAVPHGNVRIAIAKDIRRSGGSVIWQAEHSPHGTLNLQHVHVREAGITCFSEPVANPVPKKLRIDSGT